jgi:hypothetical protein
MSRLMRGYGTLFSASGLAAYSAEYDCDADARRMRADLDAIRARFPDHT